MKLSRPITVVEVGPRDGLQNERVSISTADKIELVNRLSAVGSARHRSVGVRQPEMGASDERCRAGVCRHHPPRRDTLHGARAEHGRTRARAAGRRGRSRHLRGRERDLQPQEHQPGHRRVIRHLQDRLRRGAGRGTARARLSVDRLRLPVRRRGAAGEGRDARREAARARACSKSQSATRSASRIRARSRSVLDVVLPRVPAEPGRAAFPRHARHGAGQRPGRRCPTTSRRSTRRSADSAAARTRPARPATWPPTI